MYKSMPSMDTKSADVNDIEIGWTNDPFFSQAKSEDIILLNYGEIPYFLRGNPYITSGYRAYLSFKKCLKR